MSNSITLFRQILSLVPENCLKKSVCEHGADRYAKTLSTAQLLKVHLYAHITGKDSLRDIITGLEVNRNKLYHTGIGPVTRSNLSYANAHRPYQVFEELFYQLVAKCTATARKGRFKFKNPLYALDSTKIDLCLSQFEWAKYRTAKGAMKLHHLLDIKSDMPVFMVMSEGKRHDIAVARNLELPVSSDSILVFDRGYIDFEWFKTLAEKGIWFVTRSKKNLSYRVIGQHSLPSGKTIKSDNVIELTGNKAQGVYEKHVRLVTVYDENLKKNVSFMTNNFKLAASTIAAIYHARWEIETFFRWIKQNLKIKTFLGTSKNAVMLQIWAAMIYYLLLCWIKHQAKLAWSLQEISRRIAATIFEKLHLLELLSENFTKSPKPNNHAVQMTLF
jgi:hypothetical protein